MVTAPLLSENYNTKIALFVASPFVKDAIYKNLKDEGYTNVIQPSLSTKQIKDFFIQERPEYIILDGSGLDIDEALVYEAQVIAYASFIKAEKLLLLSSSTIYPKRAPLPLKETSISDLNIKTVIDPYTILKYTSYEKCHSYNDPQKPNFILCIYPELYGPHDPRLVSKSKHPVYQAVDRIASVKESNQNFTVIANDGKAHYDLLYIDDLAQSITYLLKTPTQYDIYNISTGRDQTMETIADDLAAVAEYKGEVILDPNCYDVVARRVLNPARIYASGWAPKTSLQAGLHKTMTWHRNNLT